MEQTITAYLDNIGAAFKAVYAILRDDATVWLTLGDSYANDGKFGGETGGKQRYLDDVNRKRVGREKRSTLWPSTSPGRLQAEKLRRTHRPVVFS